MPTQLFVNLPVKDLGRTMQFFAALGFGFNERFTGENAACLVISDTISAMLLAEPFFSTFTDKQIVDTRASTEAILALSLDSRAHVDEIADKALAAGGQPSQPTQDHGFMYTRSFQDLDGHLWEVFHMDPSKFPASA
jgi:predicted lactoylglutathione lyase